MESDDSHSGIQHLYSRKRQIEVFVASGDGLTLIYAYLCSGMADAKTKLNISYDDITKAMPVTMPISFW